MSEERTHRVARYEVLDGMRGIAAFCVMIYHYTTNIGVMNNADLAVDFFFILSGFVIMHSYGARLQSNMGALEYIGKRCIRLYPMFIGGLLIGWPILIFISRHGFTNCSLTTSIASLFYNIFFLPFLNNVRINEMGQDMVSGEIFLSDPPAWSLFFEMIASLAFIMLCRVEKVVLIGITIVSFFAFLYFSFVLTIVSYDRFDGYDHGLDTGIGWGSFNVVGGLPRVFYGFTLGVIIYKLRANIIKANYASLATKYIPNWWMLYLLLLIVFAFPKRVYGLYPFLILLTLAPYLVYVGSTLNCHSKISLNLARFLGWISFPLYCLHFPIGRAVFSIADNFHYSKLFAIFTSIILTTIISIILTKLYEEPMRAYLSRKLFPQPRVRHDVIRKDGCEDAADRPDALLGSAIVPNAISTVRDGALPPENAEVHER